MSRLRPAESTFLSILNRRLPKNLHEAELPSPDPDHRSVPDQALRTQAFLNPSLY